VARAVKVIENTRGTRAIDNIGELTVDFEFLEGPDQPEPEKMAGAEETEETEDPNAFAKAKVARNLCPRCPSDVAIGEQLFKRTFGWDSWKVNKYAASGFQACCKPRSIIVSTLTRQVTTVIRQTRTFTATQRARMQGRIFYGRSFAKDRIFKLLL
jgi:hypothetical protein